ncbi:nickel pincer cofactor biosynthesis protein LarC [Latilactobacillus graminis]|uniref:Pyridinium-3,5-bisthiocarboxylic acid mononucleotide nickel insertion protein n=2 Tax=Latilactobacillus graminis TaxID=60519 RepID=A0AA89I172_9LACO|nr:nickel pincer cofactor biosynthesis protein LarC [Latilactobacillus graminis]KRM23628.1 hypothetical protein FC90_GL000092 [Latilactobacillus graminis DSM 20719]QFP80179.1 nickel pincer cofactor biosynthesis protein LarC [Latilactobacillus graminis]
MKTLVLNAFSGISGDMFLGALCAVGLSKEALETELEKLGLHGYQLEVQEKTCSSIQGISFEVHLAQHQLKDIGILEGHHQHGRNFHEIQGIIEDSALSPTVKKNALALFTQVAEAEAVVHRQSVAEVQFHEVGALDSIIDLIGAAIGLDLLGIDQMIVNELTDGSGTIKIAHGVVPVPVPAVAQMQVGTQIPIRQRFDVKTELITPTGMAIVKCLANAYDRSVTGVLEKVGYGFGQRETGSLNALRASLYNSLLSQQDVTQEQDQVMLLATNIDDMTGEQLADVVTEMITLGAKDAWVEPILMKKGRPAYKLCILIDLQQQAAVERALFTNTSVIGVRHQLMKRTVMQRNIKQVSTRYGSVHLKALRYQGVEKVTFEHAELHELAVTHQISINEIQNNILTDIKEQDI